MTTTIAILLGLLIVSIVLYTIWRLNRAKTQLGYEYQATTSQSRFRGNRSGKAGYKNAEFVNKHCTRLEDFIINDAIGEFDLRKLADLNGIELRISEGWYPMTIELIKELNAVGWNKQVVCIKEKYGSLRFYTNCEYGGAIYDITQQYKNKSEYICELCGEKGTVRHDSGRDYVACRKHYLEERGKITVDHSGFSYNGTSYGWKEIKDVSFKELDFNEKYQVVVIRLKRARGNDKGLVGKELSIFKNTIGFGQLLNHFPRHFDGLDYSYIDAYFRAAAYCDFCGYKAVYTDECECCEKKTWVSYQNRWNENENEKYRYVHYGQIDWTVDEGELYESQQKNYVKNPHHEILYTAEELQAYLEDDL